MHTRRDVCALIKQAKSKRNLSETDRQIHLPRKQCLIKRKSHQHTVYEGKDSYRETIDDIEIMPDR